MSVFLGFHNGIVFMKGVNLKQTGLQLFLIKMGLFKGLLTPRLRASPCNKKRRKDSSKGKKKVGRAIMIQESIGGIEGWKCSVFSFCSQQPNSLSLAELLPGKKRKGFFFC